MWKRIACSQVENIFLKIPSISKKNILMLAISIVLQHFGMVGIDTGLKVILSLSGAVVAAIVNKLEILSKPERIENIVHFIKTISKLANLFKLR